jgi:hypothetical protein
LQPGDHVRGRALHQLPALLHACRRGQIELLRKSNVVGVMMDWRHV